MKQITLQDCLTRENLTHHRHDGLILFDYNKSVTFNFDWDEITIQSRGIVFEEATGKLVARPLRKFFNYEELTGERGQTLPIEYQPNLTGPYMALEKLDGSCGIVFWYNDKWYVNTRGSFNSDQAVWATNWFNQNVLHELMNKSHTYVFEIIYPENRIVVDYGDKESMVLIAIIDVESGNEFFYDYLKSEGNTIGVDTAKCFHFDKFSDLFDARNVLTVNEEGFVVTFENGYKFKLKGEEYCRVHRTMSNLTPLNFWRVIDVETYKVPQDFLTLLPEEFRDLSDNLTKITEEIHQNYFDEIVKLSQTVPYFDVSTSEGKKSRYIWVTENIEKKFSGLVIDLLNDKVWRTRDWIHRAVRPDANSFNGVELPERLKRILSES